MQKIDAWACNRLFKDIQEQNPVYAIVNAITPDGNMFAASMPFAPGTVNVADRKHFRDTIRTRDFSAGEFIVGRVVGVPTILYAYPVFDRNRKIIAIVSAGIRLDKYREFMAQLNLPEGSSINIADHKNVTLYRLPQQKDIPPGTPIQSKTLQRTPADSKEGFYEGIGRDGGSRIYAYKRLWLRDNERPYLTLSVGVPRNAALHHANMELIYNLVILGLACLFAMMLAWVAGNSIIVEPLRKLVMATKRLSEGDMHVRTDLAHREDELGQLASSFDTMAVMLEEKDLERKKAEEALRESEAKYRSIFEHIIEGIFQTTPDGRFLTVNPPLAHMYGYGSPEELIGAVTNIGKELYVNPADRLEFLRILQEKGTISSGFEAQMRRKDGSALWVSMNARSVHDEMGRLLYYEGTAMDITDQKQAEAAMREREEKYSHLFNNAEAGMFRTKIDGSEVIEMNEKFLEIFGYTREEMQGNPSLLHWADPRQREEMISKLKADGRVTDFECKMLNKQGEVRWCLTSLRLYQEQDVLEGSIIDITERKRTEEKLQNQTELVTTLLDTIPNPIFYKNTSGVYLGCNRAYAEFYGRPREAIIGRTVYDISPADIADKYTATDRELFDRPGVQTYEWKAITADGSVREVVFNKATYKDAGGCVAGIVGTMVDITERKHLESQLLQSRKMEAIGTLAGGVAHDFNNILTVIIGFASLLQMSMEKADPQMMNYIDHILTAAQKAANLTQSLLVFSRKQLINLNPYKINKVIGQTTKFLKRLLTEDIEVKVTLTPINPAIMADVTQMDQILINLATNARDAMPKGGTLRIETGTATMDDEFIKVQGYGEPGDYAVLVVTDTGVGMDEKTKEHIFEPFFTTKEVGKGTGLGLSTVYGAVKQHNGYITVDSEPHKGTTFRIWFPLVHSKEEEAVLEPEDAKKGIETILVAEDDPGVRMLIVTILRGHGYVPIEAADGEEALRLFSDNGDKIDLVVCDVVMPRMNGKEVYEEIKKTRPDMKILFTSGYTRDVIIDKGVEDATVDFITKPIKPREFLAKIREVLDRELA